MEYEFDQQEKIAMALINNTPQIAEQIAKGRTQISLQDVIDFYSSLTRALLLAKDKRENKVLDIEVIR